MGKCELQQSCYFYNSMPGKMPAAVEYYCDSNFTECARFIVAKSHTPGSVPRYLCPDDIHEACKTLDELN